MRRMDLDGDAVGVLSQQADEEGVLGVGAVQPDAQRVVHAGLRYEGRRVGRVCQEGGYDEPRLRDVEAYRESRGRIRSRAGGLARVLAHTCRRASSPVNAAGHLTCRHILLRDRGFPSRAVLSYAGGMKLLRAANELLAFVIEVLALLALGWWGAHAAGWWLALLLPLAAAVLWGLFAAPKATFRVALPAVLAVKAVVFGVRSRRWRDSTSPRSPGCSASWPPRTPLPRHQPVARRGAVPRAPGGGRSRPCGGAARVDRLAPLRLGREVLLPELQLAAGRGLRAPCKSVSRVRSSTRRILPETVLGRSANSRRRTRL
ncbi:YrdB family protein [Streptacidiphilus monticola]